MATDEHTCQAIMTSHPISIRQHETVEQALHLLMQHKLLALPIVEEDGRYIGMFLRSRLVAMLLPRIVQLEERIPEVGRLLEVGFLTDSIADVQNRFREVAGRPVSEYVQTDTPVLRPSTPIMNAVLFLYRARTYLPVVDEASGQLLGVVSTWDVLGRIAGK